MFAIKTKVNHNQPNTVMFLMSTSIDHQWQQYIFVHKVLYVFFYLDVLVSDIKMVN